MNPFPKKLVAVMNEKIESGIIMNAMAHLSLGLGAILGKEELQLVDYVDADGNKHSNISKMPFIILKANSNKIGALKKSAQIDGIEHVDFLNTMTGGGWLEQLDRTINTKEAELIYYGIILYGDWDRVSELTRKFSLWK
jgi:hypothetical protein